MPGSFDFDPWDSPPPLSFDAAQIVVCRFRPEAAAGSRLEAIANVQCDAITIHEGLSPLTARFHYVLDDLARAFGWPNQFEEIFALHDAPEVSNYVLKTDERVCVLKMRPRAGEWDVLFDGFVQAPQVNLGGRGQEVSFTAAGVGVRLWDHPLYSRVQRSGDDPTASGLETRKLVSLPVRFNPDDRPNCTPDDHDEDDSEDNSKPYPIFADEHAWNEADATKRVRWTLERAARYLLARNDEGFVRSPGFEEVKSLLKNRRPKDGKEFYDPNNSDTYTEDDVLISDYDATGLTWPQALEQLLAYHGYGAKFGLDTDSSGEPDNYIEIYRKDGAGPFEPKDVYLPRSGDPINPATSNLAGLNVVRDFKNSFNAVVVDTKPVFHEVSVVLAPGFEPEASDADPDTIGQFDLARLSDATPEVQAKYRLYIADECGEGHWQWLFGQSTLPLDLDDVLGKSEYIRRRRPGRMTLLSQDDSGKKRRATLSVSRDYDGPVAKVWDGSGTWQTIVGGWRLLDDRLGIYVTAEHPDSWHIGKSDEGQEKSITLRGVSAIADPAVSTDRFFLRLTTVIESDARVVERIPGRLGSPLQYERTLYSHAREVVSGSIHQSSPFDGDDGDPIETRKSQRDAITAYARQLQAAHEMPVVAGSITIPWVSTAYQVGDAIRSVGGRDLSLKMNAGSEQGEAARYPFVVGLTWNFAGGQSTTLHISDRRAEPRRPF